MLLQYNGDRIKLTKWTLQLADSLLVQDFMARTKSPWGFQTTPNSYWTNLYLVPIKGQLLQKRKIANSEIYRGHAGVHMSESDFESSIKRPRYAAFSRTFWVLAAKCDWSFQIQMWIWMDCGDYSEVVNICPAFLPEMFSNIFFLFKKGN